MKKCFLHTQTCRLAPLYPACLTADSLVPSEPTRVEILIIEISEIVIIFLLETHIERNIIEKSDEEDEDIFMRNFILDEYCPW